MTPDPKKAFQNAVGVFVLMGLLVVQIILPATLDLLTSLAIAGGAGWAGYRLGRKA